MLLQRVRLGRTLSEGNGAGFQGEGQAGAGPVGMLFRGGGGGGRTCLHPPLRLPVLSESCLP